MNVTYRNAIADHGGSLITHIALIDDTGTELSGGSPAYARKAVTWTAASNGMVRPTADLTFNIPAGATVAGWKGYSAVTGGTDYDGAALTNESFASQGEYTLLAASTGIGHNAA